MKVLLCILLSFFAGATLLQSGCHRKHSGPQAPPFVLKMIGEIKSGPVHNPPTQVWKWETGGKTYYYITADCCDQYSYLYGEKGHRVCAPNGGFTGRGDGKCPDFPGKIKKTLIWKDTRKPE